LFIFKILYMENWKSVFSNPFFFFYNPRYLGQFIRTTTNHRAHWTPCKSNEQVRHHKDDMYVQRGSNPSAEKENKFFSLLAHDLKCPIFYFYSLVWKTSFFIFLCYPTFPLYECCISFCENSLFYSSFIAFANFSLQTISSLYDLEF
jgi:hypothetical protein